MKKFLVLGITLAFLAVAACAEDGSLYWGKWIGSNESLEIDRGKTGCIVKLEHPQAPAGFVAAPSAAAAVGEAFGAGHIDNGILYFSLAGKDYCAVISEDDRLLVNGEFFARAKEGEHGSE